MTDRTPDRPRILAVLIAGVASASGFFVITRSGLAGTLAGAAVASMIYTGAAHGAGLAVDRGAMWWIERRRPDGDDPAQIGATTAESGQADAGRQMGFDMGSSERLAPVVGDPSPEADRQPARPGARARRVLATWGPVALAVVALSVSAYSVATGTPLETVVVRERVVEKPVVKELVVVRQSTVTVTVPVPVGATPSGDPSVGTTVPSATTTTTSPPPSTTTTSPGGTTQSTDGPAPVTTITAPATPPTTTTPAAGS